MIKSLSAIWFLTRNADSIVKNLVHMSLHSFCDRKIVLKSSQSPVRRSYQGNYNEVRGWVGMRERERYGQACHTSESLDRYCTHATYLPPTYRSLRCPHCQSVQTLFFTLSHESCAPNPSSAKQLREVNGLLRFPSLVLCEALGRRNRQTSRVFV